jgi:thiamine biosynthesis lipoprotein
MPSASSSLRALTRRARPLLGTFVEISVGEAASRGLEALIDRAFERIARVHALMSFHEPSSDVSRINAAAGDGPVTVDAWTYEVLAAAVELQATTDGVFDVTVAPHLQRLGLLPGIGKPRNQQARAETQGRLELFSDQRVRLDRAGAAVDLGGIAKGFAVDVALEHLRAAGVRAALVNAGGDLAAFGDEPATIQIRDPRAPAAILTRATLQNCAMATTGGRFDPVASDEVSTSAVVEPESGRPAAHSLGASVCAFRCMVADALTKVVMLKGLEAGPALERYDAAALLIASDGSIHATTDWPGPHHAS